MELTTKQEKQLGQTQWFHATLLKHLESLKKGIDVQFNLGSELDFGPGFYITPDKETSKNTMMVSLNLVDNLRELENDNLNGLMN